MKYKICASCKQAMNDVRTWHGSINGLLILVVGKMLLTTFQSQSGNLHATLEMVPERDQNIAKKYCDGPRSIVH